MIIQNKVVVKLRAANNKLQEQVELLTHSLALIKEQLDLAPASKKTMARR